MLVAVDVKQTRCQKPSGEARATSGARVGQNKSSSTATHVLRWSFPGAQLYRLEGLPTKHDIIKQICRLTLRPGGHGQLYHASSRPTRLQRKRRFSAVKALRCPPIVLSPRYQNNQVFMYVSAAVSSRKTATRSPTAGVYAIDQLQRRQPRNRHSTAQAPLDTY